MMLEGRWQGGWEAFPQPQFTSLSTCLAGCLATPTCGIAYFDQTAHYAAGCIFGVPDSSFASCSPYTDWVAYVKVRLHIVNLGVCDIVCVYGRGG